MIQPRPVYTRNLTWTHLTFLLILCYGDVVGVVDSGVVGEVKAERDDPPKLQSWNVTGISANIRFHFRQPCVMELPIIIVKT